MKTVKVGNIAKILNGYAFKSSEYSDDPDGGFQVIRITNVQNGYISNDNQKFIKLSNRALERFVLAEGDILVSLTGNVGRFGKIKRENLPAVLNQRVGKVIIQSKEVFPDYLFHVLNSKVVESELLGKGKGIAQKNIGSSDIEDIEIPLPPIEDQKRIVKILDVADLLREKRKQAIEFSDDYLKSVFLETFGDPVNNPKKWRLYRLKNLCYRLSDGPFGSKLKTEHYVEEGVRVIRLQNIGVNKFKDNDKAYVSENYYENELKRYSCKAGEIVIATLGDPNIRACLIPDNIQLSINKADCIHCIPNKQVLNSEYLIALLNLSQFHHSFNNLVHGQTRSRVSSGQLKNVRIPLPTMELQDKFAEVARKGKLLKQKMLSQSEELETQFQSLMQKAFKGEL